MAILGPLFNSNNGWYIVTIGPDGQKKKVLYSSPMDYYEIEGVTPIISPQYLDIEDVESEIDSEEEFGAEGPPPPLPVSPQSPQPTLEEMFDKYFAYCAHLMAEQKKTWQMEDVLEEAKKAFGKGTTAQLPGFSNSTKSVPSTSSGSLSSDDKKSLSSTLAGYMQSLPSTSKDKAAFTISLPPRLPDFLSSQKY